MEPKLQVLGGYKLAPEGAKHQSNVQIDQFFPFPFWRRQEKNSDGACGCGRDLTQTDRLQGQEFLKLLSGCRVGSFY